MQNVQILHAICLPFVFMPESCASLLDQGGQCRMCREQTFP